MCRWWIQSFSSVTEEPQRWKGTSVLFASHMPLTCTQVIKVQNRPDSNICTLFFCYLSWITEFTVAEHRISLEVIGIGKLAHGPNSADSIIPGTQRDFWGWWLNAQCANRPASTGQTSSYEREMRNCKPDMAVTVSADLIHVLTLMTFSQTLSFLINQDSQ